MLNLVLIREVPVPVPSLVTVTLQFTFLHVWLQGDICVMVLIKGKSLSQHSDSCRGALSLRCACITKERRRRFNGVYLMVRFHDFG